MGETILSVPHTARGLFQGLELLEEALWVNPCGQLPGIICVRYDGPAPRRS
jgi:hypothetical protein